MSNIKEKLFHTILEPAFVKGPNNKVTVVGVGAVGMACTFSILTQTVTNEMAIVDMMEDRAKGEMLDLRDGSYFMRSANINAGSDFAITADSKIIVVTAGARQGPGETRLDLVHKNVEIFKSIIPKLMKHSTDPIFIIVSNPVDIMTYITWKLSGLPKHKVIGSGTNLDSLRFRYLLSKEIGVAVENVHGFIIGEHGDSSVPVWSGVNVGGVNLKNIDPNYGEGLTGDESIHKKVVNSAYEIIKLKGSTCWAIGLSVMQLCNTLLTHKNRIHAVTTCIQGLHGIHDEVFLSLPCMLGPQGVQSILKQPLNDLETKQLLNSADTMKTVMATIKI